MKIIVATILFFPAGLLFSQSYEGTLVYKTDFQFEISDNMAEMGLTEERIIEKMKTEGSWSDSIKKSYRQGDYISYTNFSPQSWSIYKQNTNKLYTFQEGEDSDICTVTDVSFDLEFQMTGNQPTVKKLDSIVEVNGRKCEIVRVQWKTGIYDYYFDSTFLKVDHKLFENHIYDGWADFLKISNALPVKIVKHANGFVTVSFTLIRNTEETLDSKLFEIPTLIADKELNTIKLPNMELFRIEN